MNPHDSGGCRGDQRSLLGGFPFGDLLPVTVGRDRRGQERVRAAPLKDLVPAHRDPGLLGCHRTYASNSQVGDEKARLGQKT